MPTTRPAAQGVFQLDLQRAGNRRSAWFAFVRQSEYERLSSTTADFLSEQELTYFKNRKFPRRQQSYLLGRYAAKLVVSQCLKESTMNNIDIYPGVFDQPLVRHLSTDTPGVSLSHCTDLAVALAFPAGHPMAVDVEPVDASRVAAIKSQLSTREIEWAEAEPANAARQYALIWTAREALSKVLQCGLTTPPEILDLEKLKTQSNGCWESCYANFAQYKCLSWVTPRHVLSIVLPQQTTLDAQVDLTAVVELFE